MTEPTLTLQEVLQDWRVRARLFGHKVRLSAGIVLALMLAGCSQTGNQGQAAYLLFDISDDYVQELDSAQALTRYLLADLTTGDFLGAAFIDNSSYSDRNVIAQTTFDHRPSVTNNQKRQFREAVDGFIDGISVPSHHNDITGGIMLAAERLADVDARDKRLFVISDLQEDRPPWLERDFPVSLDGVEVVALNVTRLRSDNHNPSAYRQRLDDWQQWVEANGGSWRVINDLDRLDRQIALR